MSKNANTTKGIPSSDNGDDSPVHDELGRLLDGLPNSVPPHLYSQVRDHLNAAYRLLTGGDHIRR